MLPFRRGVLVLTALGCLVAAETRAQAVPATAAATGSPRVDGHVGLMFGNGFAFWLTAPTGWVLDADAGRANGVYGTFYRLGESWREGTAVMYANSMSRAADGIHNADEAAAHEVAGMRAEVPQARMEAAPALPTGAGGTAVVRHFRGMPGGSVEAVAYVDAPEVVAVIALTARSEEAFAAALPDFARLVASYRPAGNVEEKVERGAKP
ncbi:MAG: hypothetical protein JWM27_4590 [Gemmatimonadetes bacterium]|nr:hypothetical protein [Gemmatimonadota bacterium]